MSPFRQVRRAPGETGELYEVAAALTGTLQLGSDEEADQADENGFTRPSASVGGGSLHKRSQWVEGAPHGSRGRARGAHLRVTLPAGSTKVGCFTLWR